MTGMEVFGVFIVGIVTGVFGFILLLELGGGGPRNHKGRF